MDKNALAKKLAAKLDTTAGVNELVRTIKKLDNAGRQTMMTALSSQMTDAKKAQFLSVIRSAGVQADKEVREWLVKGISKSYVAGMNFAQDIGSIKLPASKGTTLYKWVGGEKGEITDAMYKKFGQETVGDAVYFSLDPNSSAEFGDNLKSFILPKQVKLYDATQGAKSTKNVIDQLAKNPMYRKMLATSDNTDFVAFIKKQGYDGVVFFSDDGKNKWVALNEQAAVKKITPAVPPMKPLTVELLNSAPMMKPHLAAVNTLLSDAYLDFGNAITGFVRGSERILNEALKKQLRSSIAMGRLEGQAVTKIKKTITEQLADRGFTVLIDRGGNSWSLPRYSEMLTRTHLLKANNEGVVNRAGDFDIDIVEVSNINTDCDVCAEQEGEIYSLSGKSKNYPYIGDNEPPYHPNCRHTLLLRPDLE